jgi:hypothetical protein
MIFLFLQKVVTKAFLNMEVMSKKIIRLYLQIYFSTHLTPSDVTKLDQDAESQNKNDEKLPQ